MYDLIHRISPICCYCQHYNNEFLHDENHSENSCAATGKYCFFPEHISYDCPRFLPEQASDIIIQYVQETELPYDLDKDNLCIPKESLLDLIEVKFHRLQLQRGIPHILPPSAYNHRYINTPVDDDTIPF